jgi:isoamylase
MGPTLIDGGVNFAVYSERAERVELLLFEDPESELPTLREVMANNGGPVWNLHVEGVGEGQHYGYIAWGPNWEYDSSWYPGSTVGYKADVDTDGNRFNPNKLLFDPWAPAIHRDHDWSRASTASGPSRYQSTWGAGSKSVVIGQDYDWSPEEEQWRALRESGAHANHDWTDLVIYEVHPKGFTKNRDSGVDHPGTFRGIGEKAAYLQDLGINAVELLPIHEKPGDGGYWGYNTLSFFGPENTYSAEFAASGRPEEVLNEFRWMVEELHRHDIEVILDVVYNHTGEGGLWREKLYFESYEEAYEVNFDPKEVAGIYSYRGLDNHAWYALTEDGQYYWNNTGVGNQTRPNHSPMERLTLDSLHFYVEELHVDGFRFDLAGILGERDLDYNNPIDPSETLLQSIIDDPVLQQYNTRIIAEPWTAAGTGPGIGGFPTSTDDPAYAWGEWNAHFRDWWRSFLNNDDWRLNSTEGIDGGAVMTGSESIYGWNGRKPYHSVNFVTVHDGFTMYDLFSYDQKQNGCGLLNPICCDDPTSAWCDEDSGEENNRSRNWYDEATKRQMMRNMFTAILISHGTPMIYGGDEWMRSQFGNNNAYSDSADNEWNWFRWGEWQSTTAWQRWRMHDFVRDMIRLRRERIDALSPAEYGGGRPFAWKTAGNGDMGSSDWSSNRHVAIHYYDDGSGAAELLILINMERGDVTFSLPTGVGWGRLVDTQSYYDLPMDAADDTNGYFTDYPDEDPYQSANITLDTPTLISGGEYTVKANSIVILEEQL